MPDSNRRNPKSYVSIMIVSILSAGILSILAGCADGGKVSEESAVSSTEQEIQEESACLQMTFLNTGKSDCIIMDLGGSVIINDTADEDDYEYICSFLDKKQITAIDYMVLSHFDKDHIGSAAKLVGTYEVGCVLMPDYEEDSVYYEALMEALEQTGTEAVKLKEDYCLTAEEADIYISVPEQEEYDNDNNYSLIMAVTYGENRFLLLGDAMKKRTGEFLKTPMGEEQYDLVKMPHHGDYNKKLEDLMACARPVWAVLTVGQHRERLEEETVQLLDKYNCKVYDTVDGDVTVESDGTDIIVTQSNIW